MAYTLKNLYRQSLRLIGALNAAGTLDSDAQTNMLQSANLMLDGWHGEKLIVPYNTQETKTITAGDPSYTIGSGGDIDTVRPIAIEHAWLQDSNNNQYPIETHMTESDYFRKDDRANATGRPTKLFYDTQNPLGIIYLWPTPDSSVTYTLYIRSWKPFTEFSTVDDTVTFPPAWKRAFVYNLAIEIAPEYSLNPSAFVIRTADESKRLLKNLHYKFATAKTDLMIGRSENILTD